MTVRGHLWVFDEMVAHNILSNQVAVQKLMELNTVVNVRLNLPEAECESRIKKWENPIDDLDIKPEDFKDKSKDKDDDELPF